MKKYLIFQCKKCKEIVKIPIPNGLNIKITENVIENKPTSTDEMFLQDFIEKNFINEYVVKPIDRIRRSEFNKMYNEYLVKNQGRKMKTYKLNKYLEEHYGETYIKSDGIVYLKALKKK